MRQRVFLASLSLVSFVVARPAAAADASSPWRIVSERALAAADAEGARTAAGERVLAPGAYRVLAVDHDALRAILDSAPREQDLEFAATAPEVVLSLPMPDGRMARFRIVESPIMAPELAAQFPEIRTYRGQGIDDPTAYVRFDWTPLGFHAMVLSANGTFLVDPWRRGDTQHYVAYDKKDYQRRTPAEFRCGVTGAPIEDSQLGAELRQELGVPQPLAAFGTIQRKFRLALATTGEYTAAVAGGDVNGAFTEMTTAMNRVNGIYEHELAIHMDFIAGETALIQTDPVTDQYTNNDGVAMLTENQTKLDTLVGDASYDIGHVFSTGGGGVAILGVVCSSGNKAKGVTGLPDPTGDTFYVDYVAHEMGHQFKANHTFNGTTGFCGSSGQRIAANAYEPGSGSTIMGYAATPSICGSQNVQGHSDAYFHGASIDEIATFMNLTGNACSNPGAGSNTPPSVSAGGPYTIPKQTPFRLTVVSSSDINGDALTYDWEEFDANLSASPPDNDVAAARPILRSFPPTTSPTRTFPKLQDILTPVANCDTTTFECLPTRTRTMHFRVTVRDNHFTGSTFIGGTNSSTATVNVVGTAGPFKVTAPNTAVTWGEGARTVVNWAVANTNVSPVSCANVDILLSTDGGNTFPTIPPTTDPRILALATANDGNELITVPNLLTTTARVKVQCADGTRPFFDISDTDFLIGSRTDLSPATPQTVTEGNSGSTPVPFTVTLTPSSAQTVTVSWAVANGTTNPANTADFVATTGAVTFAPGSTTQTFAVLVKGDTLYEKDETFGVTLTGATNAGTSTLTDTSGTVTITNDDAPPSASIDDVSLLEGNSGTKNMVFTVSLSAVSGVTATVTYVTADGSATVANNDYKGITNGTLSFAPGTTTRTLAVQIVGDTVYEGDETFNVSLTAVPPDVTIGDGTGVGTILDDDHVGKFAFGAANFTVSEGASVATIKVIRTDGLAAGTVEYLVSDGTATSGADYGPTSGTLTFNAYQTVATFTIPILKDTIHEPSETVLLRLTNPQPVANLAQLGTQDTAVLTITDNDVGGKLAFSAAAYAVNETATAAITVRRTGGTASGVTVDYAIGGGTATLGIDYTGTTSGTLTFGAGQLAQTFAVPTLAVAGPQGNQTVGLTLSNPTNGAALGTIAGSVLTIVDDDPSVQFGAATFTAAEAGTKATITVKRTGPATGTVMVDYSTVAGGTATDGADYTGTAGTLTFTPGVLSKTFAIPLIPDTVTEGDETVNLQLSNPSAGLGIGTASGAPTAGTAVLVIKDNDPQQRLQFTLPTYTVSEAAAKAIITVKRTGSTVGTVNVDYDVAVGGTATGGGVDYTFTAGTLTFGPGQATRTFAVNIVPDTFDEGTETVNLALGATAGGALLGTPSTAVLNITDNEPVVQFAAAKYTASEVAAKATITVKRVGSTAGTAMVDYQMSDGTATDTQDYTGTSGTLTFGPGVASRTFAVTLLPDTLDEANETVNLTLIQRAGDIALGTPSTAVLTISDNDTGGKTQFSAPAYSVRESGGTATITVTRAGGTAGPATVTYATSGGTAVDGTDYTGTTGTLTFGAGETTKTFTVTILDNVTAEPNRSVNLTLSGPGGVLLGVQNTAVLWIVDDD